MEDLLARLEMDSPPVSRRLVQLLFKSFQPTDRDASVQIERVMALICMNGGAARVFYQYAHKHMSVDTAGLSQFHFVKITLCFYTLDRRTTWYSISKNNLS